MKKQPPRKFAVGLAIKLCPPQGWHVDAAAIIDREIRREVAKIKRRAREWNEYLAELDGVE